MKNVAVFFGGQSIEHDISIITGVLTVNSLKSVYNVIPVYVDKNGNFYTGESLRDPDGYKNLNYKKLQRVTLIAGSKCLYVIKGSKIKSIAEIFVAINCMHGERGEDGSLSALINLCGIALASPDVLGSSVCMDKGFTKTVLNGLNIKCMPSVTISDSFSAIKAEQFNYPLIVKPSTGGSSIGVYKVQDRKELEYAVNEALSYSERVIIEPCLENFIEINCAVFKDGDGKLIISECEKPVCKGDFLTFSDKYVKGQREFPAKIEKTFSDEIKKITAKIYSELNFKGVIRIDFFVWQNQVIVNEINTVPGSLAYYLFCKTTAEFQKMLLEMIRFAEITFNKNSLIKKSFSSGVLTTFMGKGGKNT